MTEKNKKDRKTKFEFDDGPIILEGKEAADFINKMYEPPTPLEREVAERIKNCKKMEWRT